MSVKFDNIWTFCRHFADISPTCQRHVQLTFQGEKMIDFGDGKIKKLMDNEKILRSC